MKHVTHSRRVGDGWIEQLCALLTCASLAACAGPEAAGGHAAVRAKEPGGEVDPTKAHVPLPALAGWNGTLVLDQGATGIWTAAIDKVFPQFGCPEIVAIDDVGRCHVLWSYSGKWTPVTAIADGKWLGGLAIADVDERIDGRELYTGSQQGNLYQVVPLEPTGLDYRRIGRVAGFEIHTIVAAEVVAEHPGLELIVFTSPGRMYLGLPKTDRRDGFDFELVAERSGRIRDAIVLPARADGRTEIATVGRHGRLEILRWKDRKPEWEVVYEVPMGLGRIARKTGGPTDPLVLYSIADDGRVDRHARAASGAWTHELIYAGPPGPRGLCAGRFDADPSVETLAVFGYSERVELLSRRAGEWSVETIFEDRDRGHWLCTGELDGLNGCDEIVATGYSGRIVLLSRPPGYGLAVGSAAVASGGSDPH